MPYKNKCKLLYTWWQGLTRGCAGASLPHSLHQLSYPYFHSQTENDPRQGTLRQPSHTMLLTTRDRRGQFAGSSDYKREPGRKIHLQVACAKGAGHLSGFQCGSLQAQRHALFSKLGFLGYMSLGEKLRISSKEGPSSSGAISDSNIRCSKVSTVLYFFDAILQ